MTHHLSAKWCSVEQFRSSTLSISMRAAWFNIPALIALGGCSTFPLPDDVTRKSTYDIIQQIRCEARREPVPVA